MKTKVPPPTLACQMWVSQANGLFRTQGTKKDHAKLFFINPPPLPGLRLPKVCDSCSFERTVGSKGVPGLERAKSPEACQFALPTLDQAQACGPTARRAPHEASVEGLGERCRGNMSFVAVIDRVNILES